jgi:hypothetical protein
VWEWARLGGAGEVDLRLKWAASLTSGEKNNGIPSTYNQ